MKTNRSLPKNFPSHFPKSKKEESEFGKGKKDILICKKCNAVYYYKSWHHRLDDYPYLSEKKNLKFVLCPACQMIKDKKYEGELIIENISQKARKEIINTVKNMGEEAFRRDPQDRIISIKEVNGNSKKIRILTTENQLAVRIGKKIKRTFKGRISVKYSKKESTARVKVVL